MSFQTLNIWAVFVAALSAFLPGGIWCSPVLFGNAWKKANGFGFGADNTSAAGAKVFAISFVLSLVMAFELSGVRGVTCW